MSLNVLQRDDLLRQIARLRAEIDQVKRMLSGQPIGTARIADAAITNAKIKDLTWNKAQGGTATLGGEDNGDGILEVKDQADDVKVTIDKDGIEIDDGSILIKNDDDETMIDSKGVVSTTNFFSNVKEDTSFRSISNSGAYEDIDDTSITTISFTRDTRVLIIYTANIVEFVKSGTAFAGKITLRIDSTDQTGNSFETLLTSVSAYTPPPDVATWGGPVTASGVVTLGTGTHTLKLRAQTINTNSQINVEATSLFYLVLGT
jgi:hypothetical protein